MRHRMLAPVAVVAALLITVSAACSGDDDDDAVLETRSPHNETPVTGAGGEQTTTTATGTDDATDTTGTTKGSGQATGDAPQDEALDVDMRTPGGVTLTLSRLSFDGDDIFVNAKVVNGSTSEVTFHGGNDSALASERLRLVDDAGQEYNFVEATYDESSPFLGTGAIE